MTLPPGKAGQHATPRDSGQTTGTLVVRERSGPHHDPADRRDYSAPGTILGSYRIISALREGAVGRVFIAEHIKLGRRVAMKMLRPELSRSPKAISRFFSEARAVNDIAHPNILAITDFDEGGPHPSYYIMDLLEGGTLEEMLENEGPPPLETTLDVASQLTEALSAVHQRGIVHRDLKPANIFVVPQPRRRFFVKLLDFGIAKLTSRSHESGEHTAVGDLVGSPAYMAPEQTLGISVDHRTDIYALGIVLYELTTGRRPFETSSIAEMLALHQRGNVTPPSFAGGRDLPPELEALILRCLEKAPERRPQSMDEIAATIEQLRRERTGSNVPLIVVSPPERSRPPWWIGAAAILCLGLAFVAFTLFAPDEPSVVQMSHVESPPLGTVEPPSNAPAAAPEEPRSITLRFKSDPAGASVTRLSDKQRLGATPLEIELQRSDVAERFEIRLAGHHAAIEEIAPSSDQMISVRLSPITNKRRLRPPPAKSPRRAPDDSGDVVGPAETENPFGGSR